MGQFGKLAAIAVIPTAVVTHATDAQRSSGGAVPARLAGRWAATLVNYPRVGLYEGRYELKFGPDSEMYYIVPHEGAVAQGISVNGARITFMRAASAQTRKPTSGP